MAFNELEDLKLRLTALEHQLAASEAKRQKIENDMCHYIDENGERQREIYAMAFAAYCKTHPEYCSAMDQVYKITDKKSKNAGDSKG